MPKPHYMTQLHVNLALMDTSHRQACRNMGLDESWRGTIHRIAHGFNVSREKENRVREALGLEPLPVPVPVDPCPDCGHVHTGRCHNAANPVVVVKPAPRKRTRRRYWRPCLPLDLKAEFEQRVFKFESVEDLLRYALSLDWEMKDLDHEW